MAKRDTYGYRAELARKQAKVRIRAFSEVARNENLPEATRDYARESIQNLRSLQAATRTRTTSGKKIPNRSQGFLDAALADLQKANEIGEFYIGRTGKINIHTQHEVAKASVGVPSAYTIVEVQTFYKATQAAWDKPGVSLEERNPAILKYYGFTNLRDAIRTVVEDNQMALEAAKIMPQDEELTDEQKERYSKEPDVEDDEPSPQYLSIVRPFEPENTNIVSPERN